LYNKNQKLHKPYFGHAADYDQSGIISVITLGPRLGQL